MSLEALEAIIERTKAALSEEEYDTLRGAADTLAFLTRELEKKGVSIKRLRKLIFGAGTEKTSRIIGAPSADAAGAADDEAGATRGEPRDKPKRKGHGRNGADAYQGAEKAAVPHASLRPGDPCPECPGGKVYPLKDPAALVRVTGMAPLSAKVWELERLRCHLCGQVFTAEAPEGVGAAKYDETATAMIALLKYGSGMPFNRLERLQRSLGIPLPASTQWDLVKAAADDAVPAYGELIRQAAQGKVLHNDDTAMRILDLMGLRREKALAEGGPAEEERTGIFTSGILSTTDDHRIAAFFTGIRHAGENLADVLAERAQELPPPIQMCDGLSRNAPGSFKTLLANCLAHARRKFVDVAEDFPDEVRHLLEELREVYKNDELAARERMSDEERLRHHRKHSGPVMKALKKLLQAKLDDRETEPNSGLGEAIGYMLKRWDKLTLFLAAPGAPLDNNIVERALKRAIQHRKNSLFYKSEDGARVGDMYMTLIYSAELNGADPFDFLVSLLRNADKVAASPSDWMPWNYRDAVEKLADSG